jgi:Glyoxalase-like domain
LAKSHLSRGKNSGYVARIITEIALDHLVVAARTLDEGSDFVHDRLGVAPDPGGRHEAMGTHNALLRLGEAIYLEVIAIDPEAVPPARRRWFELDAPSMQTKLASGPRLIHWVVRTNSIEELLRRSPISLGQILPLRRGRFEWRLTVQTDGHMPGGGLIPSLIGWQTAAHPSSALPDKGYALERLEGWHPSPNEVVSLLTPLGVAHLIAIRQSTSSSAPVLVAHIRAPDGTSIALSH